MHLFSKKQKAFTIVQSLPLQELYRGHLKRNFQKSQVWSLTNRPWYRKLCCFYKVLKVQPPKYPFNAIPKFIKPYSTRNLYILHLKVNPFPANVPILYPLTTTENQRFSVVFRGYEMGTLAANGLNIFWFKNILILKSYGLQVNLKVINNFLS